MFARILCSVHPILNRNDTHAVAATFGAIFEFQIYSNGITCSCFTHLLQRQRWRRQSLVNQRNGNTRSIHISPENEKFHRKDHRIRWPNESIVKTSNRHRVGSELCEGMGARYSRIIINNECDDKTQKKSASLKWFRFRTKHRYIWLLMRPRVMMVIARCQFIHIRESALMSWFPLFFSCTFGYIISYSHMYVKCVSKASASQNVGESGHIGPCSTRQMPTRN